VPELDGQLGCSRCRGPRLWGGASESAPETANVGQHAGQGIAATPLRKVGRVFKAEVSAAWEHMRSLGFRNSEVAAELGRATPPASPPPAPSPAWLTPHWQEQRQQRPRAASSGPRRGRPWIHRPDPVPSCVRNHCYAGAHGDTL
jgi:hypothetical protein